MKEPYDFLAWMAELGLAPDYKFIRCADAPEAHMLCAHCGGCYGLSSVQSPELVEERPLLSACPGLGGHAGHPAGICPSDPHPLPRSRRRGLEGL